MTGADAHAVGTRRADAVGYIAEHLEVEAKLCVPRATRLPDLAVDGATLTPLRDEQLETAYWDTPDGTLATNGRSLRHRAGGLWTAKRDVEPSETRAEASETVLVRAERHWEGGPGEPPVEALTFLDVADSASEMRPVVGLRVRRARRDLCSPGSSTVLVEMIDDDVEVLDAEGAPVGGFREVELEVRRPEGRPVLTTLLERFERAGVAGATPMPKYERALAILRAEDDG